MKEHTEDSATGGAEEGHSRGSTIFDAAVAAGDAGHVETAATLGTVADTVRRIMRADTASIASFSLADRTITWRAMSGFQTLDPGATEIVNPLRGEFAERAAEAVERIIEVRGLAGDLPVSEFPLHSAEGVRDLALVPLKARGETLGVMAVGY
ncbi:MAG: GAF domain-containing protein, partial [Acidobacteria bacterium]|nr:GAF domain-containing protein [Acidobacteriota bacterium]